MEPEEDEQRLEDLERDVLNAFSRAYPQIPDDERTHMARNFTQVLHGIISIGERLGEEGDVTHMDLANGMVYSCFFNTRLEELVSDDCTGSCVSPDDAEAIIRETCSRMADWLLGIDVLRAIGGEFYSSFIKGAVALGAAGWERDRGALEGPTR